MADTGFNPCSNGITTRVPPATPEPCSKIQVSILVSTGITTRVTSITSPMPRPLRGFNPCSNGITTRVICINRVGLCGYFRFNPCSNGITTRVGVGCLALKGVQKSFNPCSNGITTRVARRMASEGGENRVSILVLMELLRE